MMDTMKQTAAVRQPRWEAPSVEVVGTVTDLIREKKSGRPDGSRS